jgi:hypothetical protein
MMMTDETLLLIDGLNVVAIRIKNECCVVAWMIKAFSGPLPPKVRLYRRVLYLPGFSAPRLTPRPVEGFGLRTARVFG